MRSCQERRHTKAARRSVASLFLLVLFVLPSCYTLQHTVGSGPTGSETVSRRQFYLFFGAIRLGEQIDSARMAAESTSYRVTTDWSFTDMILNIFTVPLTVTSRTITVEK